CSEEQRKHIFSLLPKPILLIQYQYDEHNCILEFDNEDGQWWVDSHRPPINKTELTYPEFIKLLDSGDDNNRWIKVESESDLLKEVGDYWAVWKDGEVGRKQFFCRTEKNLYSPNGNISEYDWWMRHIIYYMPIVKPEPPKF